MKCYMNLLPKGMQFNIVAQGLKIEYTFTNVDLGNLSLLEAFANKWITDKQCREFEHLINKVFMTHLESHDSSGDYRTVKVNGEIIDEIRQKNNKVTICSIVLQIKKTLK